MPIRLLLLSLGLLLSFNTFSTFASPATTSKFIMVDQFGYFPISKKIAVISDPQNGFNAADSFSPSVGANQYQVRRWTDDVVVFSGTIQAWKAGVTHTQSGDKGWTFDFSSVQVAGSYYIFDVGLNTGSGRFEIADNVYDDVLKAAVRMFYHQRLGVEKTALNAGANWTDAASHQLAGQDKSARLYTAQNDASTARDLSGGWMDAGDANKYTTFAEDPIIQLAEAYRQNPAAFKDNYDIPESGNGVPDILDEIKWEIDFLKKMQDGTGTNGFLLKMGNIDYTHTHPISTDTRLRYYIGECTSATLAGAAMFAVVSQSFKAISSLQSYSNDLVTRAEAAWVRAKVTTSNFTTFQSACDDGTVKAGDADHGVAEQKASAFVAAVYLFEATGKAEYKTYIEANYTTLSRYNWLGPYDTPQHLAIARATKLAGLNATMISDIKNKKSSMDFQNSITDHNNQSDLYRAFLSDGDTNWGSNMTRANAGNLNLDYKHFGVNTSKQALYKEIAESYLHWFHGINPFSQVMLSNMYGLGAERSVNEIYHYQWYDLTKWDNVQTSQFGPPAGYVTGGPNKFYSGNLASLNVSTEPPQKCYRENNDNNYLVASWELTEPAIYYQAAYITLLGRLIGSTTQTVDNVVPTTPVLISANNPTNQSVKLTWSKSTDNMGVTGYEIYQNGVLAVPYATDTTYVVTGLGCNTAYSFYVKAKDDAGNVSSQSNTLSATTAVCPLVTTAMIYDDALQTGWADWSWNATTNYASSQVGQIGNNAVSVNLTGFGGLSLRTATGITTSNSPIIKFRVFSTIGLPLSFSVQQTDDGSETTNFAFNTTANQWREVTVNMADLGNPTVIKRLNIKNTTANTFSFFVDQVRIETPIVEATGFKIKLKVALEGHLSSGVMRTDYVSKNLLPKQQPFNKAPWNYAGTESLTTFASDITDWVLVVARSSAGTVIAKKAALLKSNGQVVDLSGSQSIDFGNLTGNIFVSVHQKSHLGIMSSVAVQNDVLYDFSAAQNRAIGTAQQKLIGSVWCMYAGDYDNNGNINNVDSNKWKLSGAAVNVYLSVDGDGNGIVNNLDNNLWSRNKSKVGVAIINTF